MPDAASTGDLAALTEILGELSRRQDRRLFYRLFPDADQFDANGEIVVANENYPLYARERYPRHLEFFEASATHREVAMLAANRVGKSVAGSYAVAAHLTGDYPDWWPGRRFTKPTRIWAAGRTAETTRDTLQGLLLGNLATVDGRKSFDGTGVVPGERLGGVTWKQGVADSADTVKVRHASGGWSTLGFKAYNQGRGSFEGTSQHGVWLDEECPQDVYGECVIRTATTNGVILLTFTPVAGLTPTVLQFMPQEMRPEAE